MKKTINLVVVILLCFLCFGIKETKTIRANVSIEDCVGDVSPENRDECLALQEKLKADNEKTKQALAEAAKDIKEAIKKAHEIQEKINEIQKDVDDLNIKISALESSIEVLTKNIKVNEKDINNIRKKILDRMASMQTVMHYNPMVDFIMGATSFEDLIRRTIGIKQINEYDEKVKTDLAIKVKTLNEEKTKLKVAKEDIAKSKNILVYKQDELVIQKDYYEILKVELLKKQEDLRLEYSQVASNIGAIKEGIANIKTDNITTSDGWTVPVNGDYWISAGTWEYPDGGRHLGIDFAGDVGTDIIAPANGVVVQTYDGCPTYGGLGDYCGELAGLGNQIRLVVVVNSKLYGVTIGHMQNGSVTANYQQVNAGAYLGKMGSSGSSSGPHAHVEVVYLGEESYWKNQGSLTAIANYVNAWSGDLSFDAAREEGAYKQSACENHSGHPCRIRPETIFGG